MLVLTRKPGESIVINHEIVVTVIRVQGNQIRLGIEAPKEVLINREEIERAQKQFAQNPARGTPSTCRSSEPR